MKLKVNSFYPVLLLVISCQSGTGDIQQLTVGLLHIKYATGVKNSFFYRCATYVPKLPVDILKMY